jgi:hypothetical protein
MAQNLTENRIRSRTFRGTALVNKFRVVKQGADSTDYFRTCIQATAVTDVPAGVSRNEIAAPVVGPPAVNYEGSIGQLGEFPVEVAAAVAVGDRLIVDSVGGIGRVKPVGGTALPYWTVGIARTLQATIGSTCQVEWNPQYHPAVPALDGDLAMNSITAAAAVQGADLIATDDLTVGDDAAITGSLTAADITATTTVMAADLIATDDLTVGDDAAITGSLTAADITATTTVTAADLIATDDLTVGDDAAISGNLAVAEFIEITEMVAPAAPAANKARLYCVDNGGKVELMVLFPTGAAIQLAIEV